MSGDDAEAGCAETGCADTARRDAAAARVAALLDRRTRATGRFFSAEAARVARLCQRMAERFARGGRLIAVGHSPAARSDVRHVVVEFVHPVIVGKRALPAIGLTPEAGPLALRLRLLAEPDDIVMAFGGGAEEDGAGEVREALAAARAGGCLTIAFAAAGAEWEFVPPGDDPFVHQELAETLYHILWELVHVFFEHRGLLEGRVASAVHDAGASSFLYPFLAQQEHDPAAVLADVRRSVGLKADEVTALRVRTVEAARDTLLAAADALRAAFAGGGTLIVFGNGGSATDAMDLAADFRLPPHGWPSRRTLDLTEDAAVLTALANDIGTDAIFARQIIAYARPTDVALALSTSGGSRNILMALEEARRRGLATIALVGYDGGRIREERLADHVIVSPSQHVPRIQEAQAAAYHILRELVELP